MSTGPAPPPGALTSATDRHRPKSQSLALQSLLRSKLEGLMSRWSSSPECMNLSAFSSCNVARVRASAWLRDAFNGR